MALDGLFHLVIQENNDNRLRIRRNNQITRNLRDASNPFEMPDQIFLKLFRLDKETCLYLVNSIQQHMNHHRRISRIPVHLRILVVLEFLGQGSYQTGIGTGYHFAVSQPVMSRCITEVTNAINRHLLNEWVKFPVSQEDIDEVKQGFQRLGYFGECVGVVDGSLIRIVSPPANHPIYPGPVFYCRKNFYAINVQLICDHNKKIRNVNAKYPGSVHDSAIWMQSHTRRHLHRKYINENAAEYLLGDSGYPLEPWLLVPFDNVQPISPEARYNSGLSSTRIYIEHTIGLLKNRFRCIHGQRTLCYNPIKVSKIIYTCVVLHNICRDRAVRMPNDDFNREIHLNENRPPNIVNQNWMQQGTRRRAEIVNTYFV